MRDQLVLGMSFESKQRKHGSADDLTVQLAVMGVFITYNEPEAFHHELCIIKKKKKE